MTSPESARTTIAAATSARVNFLNGDCDAQLRPRTHRGTQNQPPRLRVTSRSSDRRASDVSSPGPSQSGYDASHISRQLIAQ